MMHDVCEEDKVDNDDDEYEEESDDDDTKDISDAD